MTAQNCAVEMDSRYNPAMLGYDAFDGYINDQGVDSMAHYPSDISDNAFNYDFLPFDCNMTDSLPQNPTTFQMDGVDPALALPPPSTSSNLFPPTTAGTASSTTSPTGTAPKRRNRRKNAPLSPQAQATKRADFLEKNKSAARKCRERNRQKWDRVHERCVELEATNKALMEMREGLTAEVESLRALVHAHRKCVDADGVALEELQGPWADEGEDGTEAAVAAGEIRGGWTASPSFLASDEEDVPPLSFSRKPSASFTDSDFESARALEVPSPVNFIVYPVADVKVDGIKQEPLVFNPDGSPVSDDNLFSLCKFPGQESLPRGGLMVW